MRGAHLIVILCALLSPSLFAADQPRTGDNAEAGPLPEEAVAVRAEPMVHAPVRPSRGTVRVIHLHAEPPSVQAFYGYRADGQPERARSKDHPPHRHRHERMVERKSGSAGTITYTHGALNSTQVARVDADGHLALECLDGDVDDVRDQVMSRSDEALAGEG